MAGGWEQTTVFLACSLLEGEQAYTLNGVRVGVCPGIGPEGGFGGLPTPPLVLSARSKLCTLLCLGQNKVPYFCSRLFRSGNWDFGSFLYLLSRICPNCSCTVFCFFVFFFSFWRTGLYFLTGGQVYAGSSIAALQQGVPGPPMSQNVSFICLHCHLCVRFMLHEVFTSIISFNLCFQEAVLKKRNLKVSKLTSSLKSLSWLNGRADIWTQLL